MNASPQPILPGSTLGVLGGGQLGKMFIQAAQQAGYKVAVFTPEQNSPAAQIADQVIEADFHDHSALEKFASTVSAITFEFENIPAAAVEFLEAKTPVSPSSFVLKTAQNRLREKNFLKGHDFPTTPFAEIFNESDLEIASQNVGFPAVLKTASSGYDGKGQVKIESREEAKNGFEKLNKQECIWEKFASFESEISVLVSRNTQGELRTLGPFLNEHKNHILDITTFPANLSETTEANAVKIAKELAQRFQLQGIICIEFFLMPGGELFINEIAPRPHNSGHLTIEAYSSSQYDQQLRGLCSLPLETVEPKTSAACMVNLLGELWENGEPHWETIQNQSHAKLHLYGKEVAKPGRKMGHITVCTDTPDLAREFALSCRNDIVKS